VKRIEKHEASYTVNFSYIFFLKVRNVECIYHRLNVRLLLNLYVARANSLPYVLIVQYLSE